MSAPRFTQRQVPARDADSGGQAPAEGRGRAAETPAVDGAAGRRGSQVEIGGPKGPDPTRYGDWELKGRCIDF